MSLACLSSAGDLLDSDVGYLLTMSAFCCDLPTNLGQCFCFEAGCSILLKEATDIREYHLHVKVYKVCSNP